MAGAKRRIVYSVEIDQGGGRSQAILYTDVFGHVQVIAEVTRVGGAKVRVTEGSRFRRDVRASKHASITPCYRHALSFANPRLSAANCGSRATPTRTMATWLRGQRRTFAGADSGSRRATTTR